MAKFAANECYCQGVTVDLSGNIFLADPNTKLVSKFDSTGALVTRYGQGVGTTFAFPWGLATLPNGDIVVANGNGDAQVITPEGAPVRTLPSGSAREVATDPDGNTYFATNGAGVRKVAADGTTVTSWDAGNGNVFDWVTGVVYNPANGHVYVVDAGYNRVVELTTSGALVSQFGGFGNGLGQLNEPEDIAADAAGNVYVSQPNLTGTGAATVIKKYASDGTPLSTYAPGGQPLRLHYASGALFVSLFNGAARIDLSDPIVVLSPSGPQLRTSQGPTFDASGSSLPFGSIGHYEWDLNGDGSYETDGGSTPTIARRFTSPGNFTVGVRVTGSAGASDTGTSAVSVVPSSATLTASSNPALSSTTISFDTSRSALADSSITEVQWDLDGNGTFETNTGTATTANRAYDAGSYNIGVRVTRSGDVADVAHLALQVRPKPPLGRVGVSVNNGARFTNDPDVTLRLVWPAMAVDTVVSNDGGFDPARTIPVATSIRWRLDRSGPERLPKTVYLRFDDRTQTFQDDIILDETPPLVRTAEIGPAPASGASAVASRVAKRRYRVHLKASDRTSGVSLVQFATRKARPSKVVRYREVMTVSGTRPRYVRVRDRAGNNSRWRTIKAR